MLQTQFSQVDQPFEKALVMTRQCPDYNPCKQTSLAFTGELCGASVHVPPSNLNSFVKIYIIYYIHFIVLVMEEFAEWVKYVGPSVYSGLNVRLKHEAFQVASRQRNWNLSLLIVDVYRLVEDNQQFLPYLRKMLELHMYKEVCTLVA